MNALVQQNFGALSTRFQGQAIENDLGAGISGGFGIITFKGKVWRLRYKDNELELMRDDGDGPRGSVELVILKASTHIAKTWYEKGYEEGSSAAPDCFSNNGVTPDPSSPKKQCATCAACPRNAFGTALKQDGTPGKGKACGDFKRLAVTSLHDLKNELWGGPMLMRVPASSLNPLATYGAGVQKLGFPYYGVGTRIGFDSQDAYPKLVFTPIRPLTDEEADIVLEMRVDPQVDRILAEGPVETTPALPAPTQMAFEQPPAQQAAKPAPVQAAPAAQQAPAPAVTPAPTQSPKQRRVAAPKAAPAPVAAAPAPAKPATTAGGFGAGKPVAATAPANVEVADTSAFDAALDAELDALMGPAA